MNRQALDLGDIEVESFSIQPSDLMPVDDHPAGWETDERQNSMCRMSCDGSCRCGTL
jgi:hypothetical protein